MYSLIREIIPHPMFFLRTAHLFPQREVYQPELLLDATIRVANLDEPYAITRGLHATSAIVVGSRG